MSKVIHRSYAWGARILKAVAVIGLIAFATDSYAQSTAIDGVLVNNPANPAACSGGPAIRQSRYKQLVSDASS